MSVSGSGRSGVFPPEEVWKGESPLGPWFWGFSAINMCVIQMLVCAAMMVRVEFFSSSSPHSETATPSGWELAELVCVWRGDTLQFAEEGKLSKTWRQHFSGVVAFCSGKANTQI